jgi:hypothetical protein
MRTILTGGAAVELGPGAKTLATATGNKKRQGNPHRARRPPRCGVPAT